MDSWHQARFADLSAVTYAIQLKESSTLIGCISIMNIQSEMPELGYWLGVEYWSKGYCTEACKALMQYCASVLQLNSVYGKHLSRNPASGEVMKKCGLSFLSTGVERVGLMTREEEFKLYKIELT